MIIIRDSTWMQRTIELAPSDSLLFIYESWCYGE